MSFEIIESAFFTRDCSLRSSRAHAKATRRQAFQGGGKAAARLVWRGSQQTPAFPPLPSPPCSLVPSAISTVLSFFVNYVPFVEASEVAHGPGSPAIGTERRRACCERGGGPAAGPGLRLVACVGALSAAQDGAGPRRAARAGLRGPLDFDWAPAS